MIGWLVEVEDHLRKILFMIEIIIYKFGIKNISWRNSLSQFSVVTTKCIIYKWNIFFAPTLHRSAASHLTPESPSLLVVTVVTVESWGTEDLFLESPRWYLTTLKKFLFACWNYLVSPRYTEHLKKSVSAYHHHHQISAIFNVFRFLYKFYIPFTGRYNKINPISRIKTFI